MTSTSSPHRLDASYISQLESEEVIHRGNVPSHGVRFRIKIQIPRVLLSTRPSSSSSSSPSSALSSTSSAPDAATEANDKSTETSFPARAFWVAQIQRLVWKSDVSTLAIPQLRMELAAGQAKMASVGEFLFAMMTTFKQAYHFAEASMEDMKAVQETKKFWMSVEPLLLPRQFKDTVPATTPYAGECITLFLVLDDPLGTSSVDLLPWDVDVNAESDGAVVVGGEQQKEEKKPVGDAPTSMKGSMQRVFYVRNADQNTRLGLDAAATSISSAPLTRTIRDDLPFQGVMHENIGCDGCMRAPLYGVRYKCNPLNGCDNFDFCQECFHSSLLTVHAPEKNHEFIRITTEIRPARALCFNKLAETILSIFQNYGPLPCLGQRMSTQHHRALLLLETSASSSVTETKAAAPANEEKKADGEVVHPWRWLSYAQMETLFVSFASGLRTLVGLKPQDFVGVFSANSIEWLVADMACIHQSFVAVPVHVTYTFSEVEFILQSTNCSTLICSREPGVWEKLRQICETRSCPHLKRVVVIDTDRYDSDQLDAPLPSSMPGDVQVFSFEAVVAAGRAQLIEPVLESSEEELSTIVFTSGSTGRPKGAPLSKRLMNEFVKEGAIFMLPPTPLVIIEFHPFAWMTGRDNFRDTCSHGGSFAIFTRDKRFLFEDIQSIRPTKFKGVPAIYNKLFSRFQRMLEHEKAIAELHRASADPSALKENPAKTIWQIERKVYDEYRAMNPLGDRVHVLVTGGAPTSDAVMRFLRRCFSRASVREAYGTTEVGGITTDGIIIPGTEVKILSVPEMGYFDTDKPLPRGEICVKTPMMTHSYWQAENITNERFKDGWFHTGDIGEYDYLSGRLKIIDRINNLFKLQHGEFISPEKLEGIFLQCELLDQIFIYGDSTRSSLVAVVVPNRSAVQTVLPEEACASCCFSASSQSGNMADLILQRLREIGTNENLPAAQIPAAVYAEIEPFTAENGLLTPSQKPSRTKLIKRYREAIDQMYAQINPEDSASSRPSGFESKDEQKQDVNFESVRETLLKLIRDTSAVKDVTGNEEVTSMGMNSVSAMQLFNQTKSTFGADQLPLRIFFESGLTIDDVARRIVALRQGGNSEAKLASSSASSGSVETKSESQLFDEDMNLSLSQLLHDTKTAFVDWNQTQTSSSPSSSPSLPPPVFSTDSSLGQHVLLTGATGFLGSYLLSELLTALPSSVKVYCLVRPSASSSASPTAARERLLQVLRARQIWQEEFEDRVVCIACRLEKPYFGLTPQEFFALASQLYAVYHCAAWVNWMLPYSVLRESNVIGTYEVARLICAISLCRGRLAAVTGDSASTSSSSSAKPTPWVYLHHISTLGCALSGTESAPLNLHAARLRLRGGYNLSKWGAEYLVHQLPALLNNAASATTTMDATVAATAAFCRVSVYRPGMITGHSVTGVSNPTDFLPRYLRTVIELRQYVSFPAEEDDSDDDDSAQVNEKDGDDDDEKDSKVEGKASNQQLQLMMRAQMKSSSTVPRLVKSKYPRVEHLFEMLPVDVTARVIVTLSLDGGVSSSSQPIASSSSSPPRPQVYHVANSRANCLSFNQIGTAMQKLVSDLKPVSHSQFIDSLGRHPQTPLYPLLSFVENEQFFESQPASDWFSTTETVYALKNEQDLLARFDITPSLIVCYAKYLQTLRQTK